MTFDTKQYKGLAERVSTLHQLGEPYRKQKAQDNALSEVVGMNVSGLDFEDKGEVAGAKEIEDITALYVYTSNNLDTILDTITNADPENLGGLFGVLEAMPYQIAEKKNPETAKYHRDLQESQAKVRAAKQGDSEAFDELYNELLGEYAFLKNANLSDKGKLDLYEKNILLIKRVKLRGKFKDKDGKYDAGKVSSYIASKFDNATPEQRLSVAYPIEGTYRALQASEK
ncbi:hypothetical protein K8R33_02755 [archaeon]|nr:hypothetical protein [archaeon]